MPMFLISRTSLKQLVAGLICLSPVPVALAVNDVEEECRAAQRDAAFCECFAPKIRELANDERRRRRDVTSDAQQRMFVSVMESRRRFQERNPGKEYWRDYDLHDQLARELGFPTATQPSGRELKRFYQDMEFQVLRECQHLGTGGGEPRYGKTASLTQRRVAADIHPGVDRSVFGIELGESLRLPPCPEDRSGAGILSTVLGVGRGAAQTCRGNEQAAAGWEVYEQLETALGARGPETSVERAIATLANDRCPDWLRAGGACWITLDVREGVVLGAVMITSPDGSHRQKILQQMTQKYGKPPRQGASSECVSQLTGAVVERAYDQHWSLPGLQVSYRPLATDCKRGRLAVELDTLVELRGQERARHEANEPRM